MKTQTRQLWKIKQKNDSEKYLGRLRTNNQQLIYI